jgi:CBS domain-containing protein
MPATEPAAAPLTPSASLLAHLRRDLARHPPFAQMAPDDIDFFLAHALQRYYAPDEVLLEPASGEVAELLYIRQGAVTGVRGPAEASGGAFQY